LQTIDDALARHSYFDASYQAIRDLWSWRQEKSCDDLCQYLLTQSNLPPTARASAVEIGLTQKLTPVSGAKPNIFIFVVDSLRPDYLSPYNPAANFTPEIAKFASESTVMHNAFTRYAGTTISDPAIWAGAMLLHKHYIQPFHKVNSLERMLDTDGYQKFISVDTVLQVLLKRTPDLVPLDAGVKTWTGEDMCSTVDDAETKIGQLRDPARPVFMFAQPQNVHGITIASLGPERAPKRPYPGFVAKTASEVERLDGCFGRFVRYLKTSGLYANSIVVLTSDHGDSFGEFGHKGHALELNLSVLRVPLIIHLPDNMRNRYYNDPKQVAFNTDITATLYYLVGHLPIVNDARFGRPLFTATAEEAATYRRSEYLVASSYGPVYGILGNNGKSLFVANAVDGTNAYYDLEKDPGAVMNRIDEKLLVSNQKRVREYVQQIADLYQFQYRATTFSEWLIK
jgi:membrane-anchored protein YejM (alkaline phosphatase superfamily)